MSQFQERESFRTIRCTGVIQLIPRQASGCFLIKIMTNGGSRSWAGGGTGVGGWLMALGGCLIPRILLLGASMRHLEPMLTRTVPRRLHVRRGHMPQIEEVLDVQHALMEL